jgi:hypothetical protein
MIPFNQNDWKKWIGQVLGSKSDIERAFRYLNRNPKNAKELQNIIDMFRKQEIIETGEKSLNAFY